MVRSSAADHSRFHGKQRSGGIDSEITNMKNAATSVCSGSEARFSGVRICELPEQSRPRLGSEFLMNPCRSAETTQQKYK